MNMTKIQNEHLVTALQWRYAVKKFDASKKISKEDWETLEDSLVLSASSYGLQPWKFLVVQDESTRKKLTPASWKQTQVEDCSHFVVFLVRDSLDEKYVNRFVDEICKVRGITSDKMATYRDMMIGDLIKGPRNKAIRDWAARQAYLALGNIMTCAAVLGIDSCPMEGIIPEKYDEILNLKEGDYSTVVCLALGYRASDDRYALAKKVRFPKKDVIQYI
jgi:nitroreductase